MVDGVENVAALSDPDADPDAGGSVGGTAADNGSGGPGIFERLFQEDTGGFDVTTIGGPTIPDYPTLVQDLVDLSDTPNPNLVSYTLDSSGDPQFNVTINKTLDGTANLNLAALGGTISLTGDVDISMMVHVHLVFGIDSNGFYVDTAAVVNTLGQTVPMLSVDNIQLDADPNLTASGDFGLFDINATNISLTVDPAIGASVTLPPESPDALTGETTNLLRPQDFAAMAAYATTTFISAPGQAIAISATINVDSGLLGSLIPSSLQNLDLTFTWNDASKPTSVAISGPGYDRLNTVIAESEEDIVMGLQQLTAIGTQIDASSVMSVQIPVLDRSLGSFVQLGNLFGNNLYQPVQTYFATLPTLPDGTRELPTVSGFVGALIGASAPSGDLSLSLAPGLSLSVQGGALLLNYDFTATRTDPIALDLGLGGESPLSLSANLAVDLQTQFTFDASIGVDFGALASAIVNKTTANLGDAFFIQLATPPTITASLLDAGQGLTVAATIGPLNVTGQVQGLLSDPSDPTSDRLPLLQASVSIGLAADSQKRTTLSTIINLLKNNPLQLITTPQFSGSLGLDILITPSLMTSRGAYSFTPAGQPGPELIISTPNIFSGELPTIDPENFGTLLNFKNVSAAALLVALQQFSSYLGEFASSPAFNTTIPFTQGTTLGSLVNVAATYANQLAGLTAPSGGTDFNSIGGLQSANAANTAAANIPISFNYVPDFQSTGYPALTMTLNLQQSFGGTFSGQIVGDSLNPVVDDSTLLSDLNGGQGVQFAMDPVNGVGPGTNGPGPDLSIELSNGTILSVTFDPSKGETLGDVISQINDALGNNGDLVAAINPDQDGLMLTDMTLGTNLFNVIGQQGSNAAANLGIVGIGFRNPTLDPTTRVTHLNNGAGVSFSTTGGADLMVTLSNGDVFPITFSNPATVADLINQVASATDSKGGPNNGRLALGINSTRTGLVLYDGTTGNGTLSVAAVSGSLAAVGLGLVSTSTAQVGPAIPPTPIATSTLLTQLGGGQGVNFSTTDAPDLTVTFADNSSLDISLSAALTVGDVINQINSAAMLTPTTPISQLNDGRGVALPSGTDLTINFGDGSSLPISITSSTSLTLGGLINQLNDDAGGKLTAALAGNALVLTAAQSFSVAGSQTATDLGITGSSTVNVPAGTGYTSNGKNIQTPLTAALNSAGNALVLTSTQPFSVVSEGGGTTAANLGIAGASTGNTLTGKNINPAVLNGQNLNALVLVLDGQNVNRIADLTTPLSDLDGGDGVSFQGDVGDDLQIEGGDGTTVIKVGLGSATTVGDVITLINAAAKQVAGANPPKIVASLDTTGHLVLTDTSGTKFPFTVQSLDGSTAALDLGIDEAPISASLDLNFNPGGLASLAITNSNVFVQANVSASFTLGILLRPFSQATALTSDTLLSTLQSGEGIQFAPGGKPDINVTLHDGTKVDVVLSGCTTIGGVLAQLNAAAPKKFVATISSDGLGIVLTDTTTGPSAFTVTALNSSTAGAELGLLGTGDGTGTIQRTDEDSVSFGDNIFVQTNTPLTGTITLGASLDATASLGFFTVQVNGGTAVARATASFGLGNLHGTPQSGYSTLSDLTTALGGNVGLSVIGANPGPANGSTGITYGTSTFGLQLGSGPVYTIPILNTAVPNPKTLADLITNLNASLSAVNDSSGVSLGTQVRALASGTSVAFTTLGGLAQTLTIQNAQVLGFNQDGSATSAYVIRPSVNLTADVNLPISAGNTFSGVSTTSTSKIEFHTPTGGIAFDLDPGILAAAFTNGNNYTIVLPPQLQNLTGFNFTTFVNALSLGLNFLTDTVAGATNAGSTSLAFLNQNLPLVNVSLKDILGYATSFSNFLARLVNDPSSSLQSLANQIAGLLGDNSVTGTTLAPANGVLSSAARFQVVLNGGTGVQVTVPSDPSNTSVAGLVNDINLALATAALGASVVATSSGGYITLTTTGPNPASSIVIQGIASGNTATTQLGFSNTIGLGIVTSLTAANPAALLTSAANFQLVLNGGTAVPVTVPVNPNTKNLAGLVADLNAAPPDRGVR